jgi:hypothetical protein
VRYIHLKSTYYVGTVHGNDSLGGCRKPLQLGCFAILCVAGCGGGAVTPSDAPLVQLDAPAPVVPVIESPWWRVTGSPDLGALSSPEQQTVDFAIWPAGDGSWQIWECIRGTREPGYARVFYHWQGAHLTDTDWTPLGIALHADPSVGETVGGLQAPFVLPFGGGWRMFYGDWEHICQARSDDGKSFVRELTDAGTSGMFSEGAGAQTRDPMVLALGDGRYILYDSAYPGGVDRVYARTSTDLQTWSEPRVVAAGGAAGDGPYSAECPFVVARAGWYFLFRTQRYGADAQTRVYRSPDPLDFGVDDDRYLVTLLPVAAPEIVTVGDATYIAALRPGLDGIQIARLAWQAP